MVVGAGEFPGVGHDVGLIFGVVIRSDVMAAKIFLIWLLAAANIKQLVVGSTALGEGSDSLFDWSVGEVITRPYFSHRFMWVKAYLACRVLSSAEVEYWSGVLAVTGTTSEEAYGHLRGGYGLSGSTGVVSLTY